MPRTGGTMPVNDGVSSISGRNSRASNVSGVTGASRSSRAHPMAPGPKDTLASAGVLSMLKTSTDTGDIGNLSFNNSRLPAMPRATHQRRGHHPRPSEHHHYAPSQASRVSSSREWDSMSGQRRGSLTSMQSMPPALPPVLLGKAPIQLPPEGMDLSRDSRSFSMTSAPNAHSLPRHRSIASLRSQGHEARNPHSHPHPHHRPGPHHPQANENRPPYIYPTRLKRPGYRSPSPALSDTYAAAPPPPMPPMPPVPPMGRRMPMPSRPPPPQSYHSDYGDEYPSDPRYLSVRPPPRPQPNPPFVQYAEVRPGQHPYRNPAAARSAPGLNMSAPHPGVPHADHHDGSMAPHHRGALQPPPPVRGYPPQPMMSRAQYHAAPYPAPYPGRPAYPLHPTSRYEGHHQPPPPPPSMAPVAHHMFHQAARKARQMPYRTDTPMTDGGPPSSDPPSSGTAPTASSPPTPRDQATIQVAVDPALIDPALMDLPDSSSEPGLAHQYLRYAEGLEKDVEDTEIEAIHPSIPASGFVQRVRALLESKAAADAAAQNDVEREKLNQALVMHVMPGEVQSPDEAQLYELAANETPRFTLIEEYQAPIELPASPVRYELPGSLPEPERHITRRLVKQELAPSSADDPVTQTLSEDTSSIDELVHRKSNRDKVDDARHVASSKPSDDNTEHCTPGKHADGEPHDSPSATTSSPSIGISAVDYAMRFDNTLSSNETQSKDPFILDADTITLQHQRTKERVNQLEQPAVPARANLTACDSATRMPVSPVLTGEDVSRCSAVSPLQTQTLGIDETLQAASEVADSEETMTEELSLPGAFPNDSQPPPTPKTPKTYSKSVQLPPGSTSTTPGTTSTNRYSLPADLSTFGDSSMNDSSDMITDVAVRFSLPQTTVTITKPQIIEIPPSSSPTQEPTGFRLPQPPANALLTRSKRGSVTFADQVAPLKISKKFEPASFGSQGHDTRINPAKSIVRRTSPLQDNLDSTLLSAGSTTDLRSFNINNNNNINKRFGSTHLPGLKEESIDDMSVSDKHKSDIAAGFQFPLPARIAAVKAMQERRLHESAEKAKARRARRHGNRPLAETRDLPSLNFSRMDLIDKLNEALEVRESKSMEVIPRREFSGIYCPSPQRPQSTEPLRERYMSFFSKPEDFTSFLQELEDDEAEGEPEVEHVEAKDPVKIPTVEIEPGTEIEEVPSVSRPLSPEDFMDFASQIDRLSIPSVNGLSDRLSGLLPNLRDLQLDTVLANFKICEVTEDLRRLGHNVRPETLLSTRTSAGLLSLAERAEAIVKNGTHDSTVPIAQLLAVDKDLPALPGSLSTDKVSAVTSTDGKQSYLSGSVSAPSELGNLPIRPASAMTRHKSPTNEDEVQSMLPPEMNPIARHGKRAMVISSSSTRPWNQDENYPWSGTALDIDLAVPSEAHARKSAASEILRQRKTKSLELTTTIGPNDITKGIDIGSIYEKNPTASLTNEQLTGVSTSTATQPKASKRSVIGSITQKIGLGSRADASTTRSVATPSDMGRSTSTVPHRPGERYPTSGLTPPVGFNLDEVRSFFSDNSSEKERNASFRKRLTKLKTKKSVRLEATRGQSIDDDTAYDAGLMSVQRAGALTSAHTIDGVGMSKTEFHIKRFGEKLRILMAKGGELIRSLSQRSKSARHERVRDDWLSDSLYSGV